MARKILAVIGIISILTLMGCGNGVVSGQEKITSAEGTAIRYYHDKEHKVGIWIYQHVIFVLPDSEYNP